MQRFDIVINGNDVSGLVLACGLADNFKIAILHDDCFESNIIQSTGFSIVNMDSSDFLRHLQIWNDDIIQFLHFYREIEFWGYDNFGKVVLDNSWLYIKNFGYIVENKVIYQTLWQRIENLPNIVLIRYKFLRDIIINKDEIVFCIDNFYNLSAKLVFIADGINSFLRSQCDTSLFFLDHQNYVLWVNINTEIFHSNIIRVLFHSSGLLVFLPLQDPNVGCVMWLLSFDILQKKLHYSVEQFNAEIISIFYSFFGKCRLQGMRRYFTCNIQWLDKSVISRFVLVGRSSYSIYPLLFGYEINLYLMEIKKILEEILLLGDIESFLLFNSCNVRYKREIFQLLLEIKIIYMLFSGSHRYKKLSYYIKLRSMISKVMRLSNKHFSY
ncbi:hypothetical protein GN160_00915 [Blochmannia endosymbiont of Colobopsis nipponica]|uniref:hypothetical protein n=1 Tax=Blochmannia endosymbiont of Colobopsis nipponica TaxID=2681987 RepID=UPI00177E9411|nr:hypothetical protein [Blochmannia endosymbiont of Colobopsis nipponica]QOI11169.1 hypothetical protein GN160_00915 [Blochmannia endosymbiont of Colobopsis nipponica]